MTTPPAGAQALAELADTIERLARLRHDGLEKAKAERLPLRMVSEWTTFEIDADELRAALARSAQ